MNHGYLKDAIVTENNTYVESHTVNNILNEMWYGTERINGQTVSHTIVLNTLIKYTRIRLRYFRRAFRLQKTYK